MDSSRDLSDFIKESTERSRQEFAERVKAYETCIGCRVKHLTYLLDGVVVSVEHVQISYHPIIYIKWDNGAESGEQPNSIQMQEGGISR